MPLSNIRLACFLGSLMAASVPGALSAEPSPGKLWVSPISGGHEIAVTDAELLSPAYLARTRIMDLNLFETDGHARHLVLSRGGRLFVENNPLLAGPHVAQETEAWDDALHMLAPVSPEEISHLKATLHGLRIE